MDDRRATEAETAITRRIASRLDEALPGTLLRFVARVQEPGENGLLVGVHLPRGVYPNSEQAFSLFDLIRDEFSDTMPIGLTIAERLPSRSESSRTGGPQLTELPLDFLPDQFVSKPIYAVSALTSSEPFSEPESSRQLRLVVCLLILLALCTIAVVIFR